jgi:hypothetical protein
MQRPSSIRPYSPDPRHKAILYKNGSPAIVVRLSVNAPCLSLFAVAHFGSITGHPELSELLSVCRQSGQKTRR